MDQIARHLPARGVLVEEAPTHRNALHDYLPIKTAGGFYAAASGGLGWAVPAAVGVALADPRRKVVCLVGDGSSLYSIQALWTAVQHKVPVAFVILNNQGYGAMKSFGEMLGIVGAPGHDVPGVDFVAAAHTFACGATRVERAAELAPALRTAFAAEVPWLVEVRMDAGVKRIY
jgi:benzoylformate decarboxylase